MAGPIRNLISMMRENRQQRLESGTALFPGLRGRMRPEGEPRPGVRKLLRSLGVGSSRSDYLMQRKAAAKPEGRAGQDDASGPDTTYSRPYSGDGVDKETASAMTTVSNRSPAAPEPIPSPMPEPVRSDGNSMPDVEATFRSMASEAMTADPKKLKAIETAATILGAVERNRVTQEALKRASEEKDLPTNLRKLNEAARQAAINGDHAGFQAMFFAGPLALKGEDGRVVGDPDVAGIFRAGARPVIRDSLNIGVGKLTPEEQARLRGNIAFAYPVQFKDAQGRPTKPTPQMAQQQSELLFRRLVQDFGPKSDQSAQALLGLAREITAEAARTQGLQGNVFQASPAMNIRMGAPE